MKLFLRNGLNVTYKAIIATSIVMCFGIVGDMNINNMITLDHYRLVMIFAVLIGFVVGGLRIIFYTDKLTQFQAYVIHFIISYISFNVLEGLVFEGSFLPSSPPINYLFKLIIFGLIYALSSYIEHLQYLNNVKAINEKIQSLQNC